MAPQRSSHSPNKLKFPYFILGGDTNPFGIASERAAGVNKSVKSNIHSYLLCQPLVNK